VVIANKLTHLQIVASMSDRDVRVRRRLRACQLYMIVYKRFCTMIKKEGEGV